MAADQNRASKRTNAGTSAEDWAKEIEARVNANPALVKAIKEGHKADPKKSVPAKDYFQRRHGRSNLADVSLRVREESMRVNAEFAAFEHDPDASSGGPKPLY